MLSVEKEKVFIKIVPIIAERLNIEKQRITLTSTLDDLGADSLDLFEIILDLEDTFSIEINDETAEKLTNIEDVVNYVYDISQS